jgi:hypothetical protein
VTIGSRAVRTAAAAGVAIGPLVMITGCDVGQPVTARTTTITITPTGAATTATTSTTTPAVEPPTSYAQAMQHFSAGKVDTGVKATFTSPSGNIFCSIAVSGGIPAGCEIKDGRISPPAGMCDTEGGAAPDIGRIEWSGDTPKPICNSDSMISPGAVVLQYGSIATVSGSPFQCLSEAIGMTCINTAGKKGFFMAKGAYKIF